MKQCKECRGTGLCRNCGGSGRINNEICPLCYPSPGDEKCKKCKGAGKIE